MSLFDFLASSKAFIVYPHIIIVLFIYSVTYKVNLFGKAFAHVRNYLWKEKHMYDTNKNIDENDTNMRI
jgi:hypothetical protein